MPLGRIREDVRLENSLVLQKIPKVLHPGGPPVDRGIVAESPRVPEQGVFVALAASVTCHDACAAIAAVLIVAVDARCSATAVALTMECYDCVDAG